MKRNCVWCHKPLKGRKLKYCNELCRYRHLSVVNDTPAKFSISQHLRMARAGRSQRMGRVGVRFN